MARPARFSPDDILDGALQALADHGKAFTIADVSAVIGAPSGSIYHRFESRDEVLTQLWIRSISRFHVGLLAAYEAPDARQAVRDVALHIPTFCREHPLDALGMTLFRQTRLAAEAPAHLREQVATINDPINAASAALVRRRYQRFSSKRAELLTVATRLCPYGLVRPFVGGPVPDWLDDAVLASTEAIAALGD